LVMLEAREAISAVLDNRTIADMRALALANDLQLIYDI
jgi:DNA-binding IscR family transcriptional regulator